MNDKAGPRINPALDRHPKHAILIGKIILAFGEIEFSVCANAGNALGLLSEILATLYQTRASSARLDFAQNIIVQECKDLGLTDVFETTRTMVAECVKIRNQYAHCNWADSSAHKKAGLFFADLQDSEFDANAEFFHHYRHVSPKLLKQQLSYFAHTLEWLRFLDNEIGRKQGRSKGLVVPRPSKLAPPPLHNPPQKHIPPFLGEGQRLLFVQHIEAMKTGAPRPTPAQRDLEKARAEKQARKNENARRAQEGEQRAKSRFDQA